MMTWTAIETLRTIDEFTQLESGEYIIQFLRPENFSSTNMHSFTKLFICNT